MSEINIRSKPTKKPTTTTLTKTSDFMTPSPELINQDLKAAVVQMESIESIPPSKFKIKDPIPRSPAPLPEAVSPAGVPIDLNNPEMRDINAETVLASPKSARGEFKIDLRGLEEVDMTVEGKKPEEYKRNVKGSLVVIALLLVSLHLFLNHLTMFTWVVNFDSPELITSALFYIISTIMMVVMFLSVLAVPSLSINEDKLTAYYSPIVVAGVIDLMAVWIGGGIFSPLSIYTLDSMNYVYYNQVAALLTILINGLLYYAFTRKEGRLGSLVHPFERIQITDYADEGSDKEVKSEAV